MFEKLERPLFLLLFLAFTSYLVLRAIYVPLAHDEAETFFIYMVNGDFLPYQGYHSANNHFLNSFLGWICFHLFGPDPWSIRLPNLIFIPVFCFYLYQLTSKFDNALIKWAVVTTLCSTPFFIDFFSLARGYGMAMGCLLAFVYHSMEYLREGRNKSLLLMQVWGLIMLAASLTTFYVFLIVLAMSVLRFFWKGLKEKEWSTFFVTTCMIFQLVPAAFFAHYTVYLGSINELVVGTLSGMYNETVEPYVYWLTGTQHFLAVGTFVFVFFIVVIWWISIMIATSNITFFFNEKYMLHSLLIGSLIFIAFNGYVLDIPFPRDRAALFLYPLFILSIGLSLQEVSQRNLNRQYFILALLFFPISLIASANFTHSHYWKSKRINPDYYNFILSDSDKNLPSIGGLSLRETIWYQHIFSNEDKLSPLYILSPDENVSTDYKIQTPDVNPDILEDYELLFEDDISENNLYRRKSILERELGMEGALQNFETEDLYIDLIKMDLSDDLLDTNLLLELSLQLMSEVLPVEFSLVSIIEDQDKNWLSYQNVRMSRIKYQWNRDELTRFVLPLDRVNGNGLRLHVYLMNNEQVLLRHKGGSFKLYKFVKD